MGVLILVLVVLLITGVVTVFAQSAPGYVLISYGEWNIETSVALAAVAILLTFVVLYVLLRLIAGVLSTPAALAAFGRRSRRDKARRKRERGLLALAEGNWSKAESQLIRSTEHDDSPLISFLAAARAAQMQGGNERRDDYLRDACACSPDADLAVGLSKAELQLAHDETEPALATLQALRERAPKHGHVLKLLARLHYRLRDWRELAAILPRLRKSGTVDKAQLALYESRASEGVMEAAAQGDSLDALKAAWNALSKTARANPALLRSYARQLQRLGDNVAAEALIRATLNRHWDEALAYLYGQVEVGDDTRQLEQIETWLKTHERSPMLLLSAGRLCNRKQLWGKAKIYFESSLGIEALPETCRELAKLAERLGDQEEAAAYYRKGLVLALEGQDEGPDNAIKLPAPEAPEEIAQLEQQMYPV